MISVEKALQIISKNVHETSSSIDVHLSEGLNYVLFSDIKSPINMPPFKQSAMDGYALHVHDSKSYKLIGEVKAGDHKTFILKPGQAVKIFTGAPVPNSANTVIMQEKTSVVNNRVTIRSEIDINENIRPIGEQVIKGELALKKGVKLNPAAIAFLTTLGITQVQVFKKPSIAIVVTGNELIEAGSMLKYGQIYESNAIMLSTALKQLGYRDIRVYNVNDSYDNTLQLLEKVISENDVVLTSGGISVGDYDFVGGVLNDIRIKKLFYKVKQKPGKPLFFGMKKDKVVFALPGNPAATLSCLYIYVLMALERLSGNLDHTFHRTFALSNSDYIKKGDRAQFLKAIYNNGSVKILDGQSSSMLHTFALSNALVYLSEKMTSIKKDDQVEVIILPIN